MAIYLLTENGPDWPKTLANVLDKCTENDTIVLPDDATSDLARNALRRRQDQKYVRIMSKKVFEDLERDCKCASYAGTEGTAEWDCPVHGHCSTASFIGVLRESE